MRFQFFCYKRHKIGHTTSTNEEGGIVTNCNCTANHAIECTVKQCAHHCDTENYCSLNKILVGTHEANPTVEQCTDCMSFEKK